MDIGLCLRNRGEGLGNGVYQGWGPDRVVKSVHVVVERKDR